MKAPAHTCKTRAGHAAVVGISLLVASSCLAAIAWQDGGAIRTTAEEAARQRFADTAGSIKVAADPLDSRLRVQACDQALSGALPALSQETGRVTVEVRCAGTHPWRLFVPVRVTVLKSILIAAAPLERGKVLTASDVILAEREVVATPGGYVTTVEGAVGQFIRRSVPAGTVLTPAMLDPPVLVRRGQNVTLEARSGPIIVRMAGVAKGDGTLGEIISVENVASRKLVQGIVRNEKAVEILVP